MVLEVAAALVALQDDSTSPILPPLDCQPLLYEALLEEVEVRLVAMAAMLAAAAAAAMMAGGGGGTEEM